jgi:PAS domain S-box-containing protein
MMVDCNQALCDIFGASREELIGQSFQILYPSVDEFERTGERIAPILNAKGHYADDRLMKRVHGPDKDAVFWCHVSGRSLYPEDPHQAGIWSFEDLSATRPVSSPLSPREREVAALLCKGMTAKSIGKELGISHRTVEIHRSHLLRKYSCHSTTELIGKLAGR